MPASVSKGWTRAAGSPPTTNLDPIRTYTPAEEEALARNLFAINKALHAGQVVARLPGHELLKHLHRQLFNGVREHAGRYRSELLGADFLVFGPNRSVHRDQIVAQLDIALAKARTSLDSIERNPTAEGYDHHAISLAAWIHAEVIRVHPFEDGNGRTARAMMNCVLVRLGLNPIPIIACKNEYNDALNTYHLTRQLDPLVDLLISLSDPRI